MEELKKVFNTVLKENYANFNGRATRKEFWLYMFMQYIYLFVCLMVIYIIALIAMFGTILSSGGGSPFVAFILLGIVYGGMFLLFLPILIPFLAVTCRRLHDTGRSGWWMLLGFIPLGSIIVAFFLIQRGEKGSNKYGEDPRIAEYKEYLANIPNY